MNLYGKGRGSGVEVRQDVAHLMTLRAGKMIRLVVYTDRSEALRDARVSE